MNHNKIVFLTVATLALICIDLYEFAVGLGKARVPGLPKLSGLKVRTSTDTGLLGQSSQFNSQHPHKIAQKWV